MTYQVIKEIYLFCPQTHKINANTTITIDEFIDYSEAQDHLNYCKSRDYKWDTRDDRAVKYSIIPTT